ncbi:MAG TPA: hypothetical protein VLC97_09460 [Rhodanobacteraceae bacterium]|nr:hypothetical protein [Rhodanobacteraceae bacterium]
MSHATAIHAVQNEWPDETAVADTSRCLTLVAVNTARAELSRFATQTDSPDWRVVDAADHLDAAHALLSGEVCR